VSGSHRTPIAYTSFLPYDETPKGYSDYTYDPHYKSADSDSRGAVAAEVVGPPWSHYTFRSCYNYTVNYNETYNLNNSACCPRPFHYTSPNWCSYMVMNNETCNPDNSACRRSVLVAVACCLSAECYHLNHYLSEACYYCYAQYDYVPLPKMNRN
jgi:hypothetical protein